MTAVKISSADVRLPVYTDSVFISGDGNEKIFEMQIPIDGSVNMAVIEPNGFVISQNMKNGLSPTDRAYVLFTGFSAENVSDQITNPVKARVSVTNLSVSPGVVGRSAQIQLPTGWTFMHLF